MGVGGVKRDNLQSLFQLKNSVSKIKHPNDVSTGIYIFAPFGSMSNSSNRPFYLFNLYSSILATPFGQLCRSDTVKGQKNMAVEYLSRNRDKG